VASKARRQLSAVQLSVVEVVVLVGEEVVEVVEDVVVVVEVVDEVVVEEVVEVVVDVVEVVVLLVVVVEVVVVTVLQLPTAEIVSIIKLTPPVKAYKPPSLVTSVSTLMEAIAIMFPENAVPVPSVVELPTAQ